MQVFKMDGGSSHWEGLRVTVHFGVSVCVTAVAMSKR